MSKYNNPLPMPSFDAVIWLCAQIYHNPPGKRGRPPINLSLEIMDCRPDDAVRFSQAPSWFAAMQQPREFRRTAKGRLSPEVLSLIEPVIDAAPADARFGVLSPENVAVYRPEEDGSISVAVLFADGDRTFNLKPAENGKAAFRAYHDPDGLFLQNRLHIVNRRKVSPMEGEIAKLREAVALLKVRDDLREQRIAHLEAEVRQLRAETYDLTTEIVRINQNREVRTMAPVLPRLSAEDVMARVRARTTEGRA